MWTPWTLRRERIYAQKMAFLSTVYIDVFEFEDGRIWCSRVESVWMIGVAGV